MIRKIGDKDLFFHFFNKRFFLGKISSSGMEPDQQAEYIVRQMFENDAFSRWLDIERLRVAAGECTLRMRIRPEMCNGFGIAHGAITYALADSALAFASNSRGRHAVSVETSISHTAPLQPGDVIVATAKEEHLSHKIGIYRIEVKKEEGGVVALFKGTVYRRDREWGINS